MRVRWLGAAALTALLAVLAADQDALAAVLGAVFPGTRGLYPRAPLGTLLLEHLGLVTVSSAASVAVGLGIGVAVSRPGLRFLRPLGDRLAALAQTFPPAGALALAVPVLGFGFAPTIWALFLYGTLPVLRGTLAGMDEVPAAALEAAHGLGFGSAARLVQVEAPLAFPFLWSGIRTSVVVNVGTATLGATIGAGGLGAPIVSGLVTQNYTFVWEGALAVGLLALAVDAWFAVAERARWQR